MPNNWKSSLYLLLLGGCYFLMGISHLSAATEKISVTTTSALVTGSALTIEPQPTVAPAIQPVSPSVVTPTPIATPTAVAIDAIKLTTTPTLIPTRPPDRALYLPVVLRQEPLPLRNGDFEQESAYWQESSSGQYRLIFERPELEGILPHGGEWAAWLGGKNGEISELDQQVTVPFTTPFLGYWYLILAQDACGTDNATILIDEDIVEELILCAIGNTNRGTNWQFQTIDLTPYAGLTVTLRFRVENDSNNRHSNLYLDDIGWVNVD